MFSSKVDIPCFLVVKEGLSNAEQEIGNLNPETSEAASLDAASVPEKETQWPNRINVKYDT